MTRVRLILVVLVCLFSQACSSEPAPSIPEGPTPHIPKDFYQPNSSNAWPVLSITEYGNCENERAPCFDYKLVRDGMFFVSQSSNSETIGYGLFTRFNPEKITLGVSGKLRPSDYLCENLSTSLKIHHYKYQDSHTLEVDCDESVSLASNSENAVIEKILSSYGYMQRNAFQNMNSSFGWPEGELVFLVEATGGCFRGNNCTNTYIYEDGKFVIKRYGTDLITGYGTIDKVNLNQWLETTDYEQLNRMYGQLDAGACASCADGIDLRYWIFTPDGTVYLNSQDKSFNPKQNAFFKMSQELLQITRENTIPTDLFTQK